MALLRGFETENLKETRIESKNGQSGAFLCGHYWRHLMRPFGITAAGIGANDHDGFKQHSMLCTYKRFSVWL